MPVYSDTFGFPESGLPVLADASDRIALNTLYVQPLKPAGFVIDVTGANRLSGALTVNGAVTGVTSLALTTTATHTVATTGVTFVGGPILNGPAATSGATVQYSPVIRFSSQAWNTTPTAATKINAMDILVIPTSGGTTSARMVFKNTTVDGSANATELMSVTTGGVFTVGGAIVSTSNSGGIGYTTGAGGTVTQITSRTTGVTINKICGAITTDTTSLAAGATAKFTVTNSSVVATDVIALSIKSGTTTDQTDVNVQGVAAGSFDVVVANRHASTAETGAIIINFAIINAVTS